jgi:GxxExxY protein
MTLATHKPYENDLSYQIIKEAMYVHTKLGPGLLESVYANCLFHRLIKLGLTVQEEFPIPVIFDEMKLPCGYRADMLVENLVIIEVKAVDGLNDIHKAQLLTYLKLSGVKLGLLLNFNVLSLKDGLKRVVNGL